MDLILDTNIYRNLARSVNDNEVEQLANNIKRKATECGIEIFFPINSAMELIGHYNDDDDRERTECRKSLNLLVNLSTTYSLGNLNVKFTPPLDAVLERYFGGKGDEHARIYSQVIDVAQNLAGNIVDESKETLDNYVRIIKEQIEHERTQLRDMYEALVIAINDNGDADWGYFRKNKPARRKFFKDLQTGRLSFLVAQGFVIRGYNIIKKNKPDDDEYYKDVSQFIQEFCPALLMNELILEKIGHGIEALQDVIDERWNTLFDISLILGALFNPNKVDRRLVTEEKKIHEAYDKCAFMNKTLDLKAFKAIFDL